MTGDPLDDVVEIFPEAVFDILEAGWSVRLDHPLFDRVFYSSRRWPTQLDDDGSTIRSVTYFLRSDAEVDAAAARLRSEAFDKWPRDRRESIAGGYRTIWRDFSGQLVILDRQRLLICRDCDWPTPAR